MPFAVERPANIVLYLYLLLFLIVFLNVFPVLYVDCLSEINLDDDNVNAKVVGSNSWPVKVPSAIFLGLCLSLLASGFSL